MSQKNDFKYESLLDNESIIKHLATLTEGFKKGELVFKRGKEEILLKPEGLINLEIKSKVKDGKSKLTVKFSWKKNTDKPGDKLFINTCI
ncbi:amphi-Trp domain-containing protein [candidate division WOR-3 bacterium]|nr:amphi-Trp domain-containing protein [candidate division WOR-3 bacterium]